MAYKMAYDKIIEAYFKDEIKPFDAKFCFCGTLCGNSDEWYMPVYGSFYQKHYPFAGYTGEELYRMEKALLKSISTRLFCSDRQGAEWENSLFQGMSDALDVLKDIHRSRGEDVDSPEIFTKRELVCV